MIVRTATFLMLAVCNIPLVLCTKKMATDSHPIVGNPAGMYRLTETLQPTYGPPRKLTLSIACDSTRPCISAHWLPPLRLGTIFPPNHSDTAQDSAVGHLLAYRIRYSVAEPDELILADKMSLSEQQQLLRVYEKNVTQLQFSTTAGEHLFGVTYEVRIAAVSHSGIGQEASERIQIPEAAPSDAPTDFRILDGDETSIHLTWGPPHVQYRNGQITQYQVRCYILGSEESTETLRIVKETDIILDNLPAATHACFVRAWTSFGPGPWSNRIMFRIHGVVSEPPPPMDVSCFRQEPSKVSVKWRAPVSGISGISHYVVYYRAEGTSVDSSHWQSFITKKFDESAILEGLDANQNYVIRISSVGVRGNEGPSSEVVIASAWLKETRPLNGTGHTPYKGLPVSPQLPGRFQNPDDYTVRNFKCSTKSSEKIDLEWLSPLEVSSLAEFEVSIVGRKEFVTSTGVVKSVHLGERKLRKPPKMTTEAEDVKHPGLISSLSADQKSYEIQITDLIPNGQYEFTARPMYRSDMSTRETTLVEGISVTVICRTDWQGKLRSASLDEYLGEQSVHPSTSDAHALQTRAPDYVRAPELEAIHSPPRGTSSSGIFIELKVYRTSEENSPIHHYYVLVLLYEPKFLQKLVLTGPEKAPHQYDLIQLSNNAQLPENRDSYLAIDATPQELFKENKESAFVMLGSEQLSRVFREVNTNESPNIRHARSLSGAPSFGSQSSIDIRAVNKPIDPTYIYLVALRACSQYEDGRRLCSSSSWSKPINPTGIAATTAASSKTSSDSPAAVSATVWDSSKLTTIIISLACGLAFFATLSIILACILRRRKRQLTDRHILGSATQWDARICEDISKSMMAEDLRGYGSMGSKQYGMKEGQYKEGHPPGMLLGMSSSGLHSPSSSSTGLLGLRPFYPSSGGLAIGATTTSLNAPSIRSSNGPPLSDHTLENVNSSLTSSKQHYPRAFNGQSPPTIRNAKGEEDILNGRMKPMVCDSPSRKTYVDNEAGHSRSPIPIPQFIDFVRQANSEVDSLITQEFQTIKSSSTILYSPGIDGNEIGSPIKKSFLDSPAYGGRNVHYPYGSDLNRADLLNATYVDGYRKQNAYIVTQTPNSSTFSDFWSMLFEQRCAVIVMMNEDSEEEIFKNQRYYPQSGSCTYGKLNVTHLETTEMAYYTMRIFKIQELGSSDHRRVWQLQYTNWPDQCVPTHSTTFLTFLRRVEAVTPPDCGPLIVHCSAETGRTGLFVAVDILLSQIKHEKKVDVYGLVSRLRAHRTELIQTREQYQFIYNTVLESVLDGNTEIFARNLFTHVQHLELTQTSSSEMLTHSPGSIKAPVLQADLGCTGFQLEFRKINAASPILSPAISSTGTTGGEMFSWHKSTCRCDVARLSVNRCKNRMINILPFDWNRVSLCPIRGVHGSDYINASYVDGYRAKNAYIACQAPLASTVEDFWRMVWEQKSEIIVMMCGLIEGEREKCFKYWPTEKPARYQFFVVDLTAEFNMSGHIQREFKITDARDGESRTVRQLQYTRWPEQGVPAAGESMIDLIGQVHRLKEQTRSMGPITVHCSTGAGRTGVFIAMCNVLERLRQESVVDMYQTVKLLRQQRVWLVQTEEQYQFCYLSTIEYLSSFDLCAHPMQVGRGFFVTKSPSLLPRSLKSPQNNVSKGQTQG
ncbi:unnamed protein product [Calicophoron daubneyi]|uniref:protein-tyrosine-phosphatase n=1 Tax=Calicophoron daubneyi TaxID=300641 RepID=A0AAV2T0T5_CALDB